MRKRRLKKVQQAQIRSSNNNDPLIQSIIQSFEDGMQSRQISNLYKVDLDFVYAIKNKFCKTVKTKEVVNEPEPEEVETETEDTTVIKEEDDMVVDQDKIETYVIMYMDGKSIQDISKETGDNEDDIFDALHEYHKQNDDFNVNDVLKPSVYHMYKQGNYLTTAGKEYVMEKIDSGVRVKDIAKELHISTTAIYTMLSKDKKKKVKEAKAIKNVKVETKEEVKPIEKKEELPYTTIYSNKPKLVGLIDGRHEEMPINEFIFHEVSSNLMFDYAKQETLCREYIENIKNEGYQSLEVFITGLGCITASLTKVAIELNFPLTLKHYDKKTDTYKDQIIIPSEKSGNIDNKFNTLLAMYDSINLMNDNSDTIGSTEYKYIVLLSDYTGTKVWLCRNNQTIITMICDWVKLSLKCDHETNASVYKLVLSDLGSYYMEKKII